MKLLLKNPIITLPAIAASLCGSIALAAPPTVSVNAFITNDSVPVEATIVNDSVPVHDVGDATRHVSLNWSSPSGGGTCSSGQGFVRVDDDGNYVGPPPGIEFVVPAGYVLNVKEVSWAAQPPNSSGFFEGRSLVLSIGVVGGNTAPYRSKPLLVTAENKQAQLGDNESLGAGFNVGSGNKVCASLSDYYYGGGNTWYVGRVYLRGTLVPTPSR